MDLSLFLLVFEQRDETDPAIFTRYRGIRQMLLQTAHFPHYFT